MWKYITVKQSNEYLLSLQLIDNKKPNEYIKELYSISNNIINNYKLFKIKKRSGLYRTLYVPSSTLKHIEKQILNKVLYERKVSKYAKAYIKNINLKENVKEHINQRKILKLDIKNFFESITFEKIYTSCFGLDFLPKNIGVLLTKLCTYYDYLPTGSPTSGYISNLVMKDFDEKLGTWCTNHKINYSRYSDDMTFSGDFNPREVINEVNILLKEMGLQLNKNKTILITNNKKQKVTGLIVNKKINTDVKYRKKIRQEIYYIKKFGLNHHMNRINEHSKKEYLNNLYGRIQFIFQINKTEEFIEYQKYIISLKKEYYLQ